MPSADPATPPVTPGTRYDRATFAVLVTLVVLPLYALDQLTKFLVLRYIAPGEFREVIPAFFTLVSWGNTGAAFSMFSNSNGMFIVISAVALVALGIFYRHGAFETFWTRAGFTLLLPGVLGNLTDRLLHGHVVDFLLFDLHVPGAHPWPAFNVADSCICVAVGCFLVGSWQDYRAERMKDEGRKRPNDER